MEKLETSLKDISDSIKECEKKIEIGFKFYNES